MSSAMSYWRGGKPVSYTHLDVYKRQFRFRERALAHAESCSACGLLLTDGEALDFALRNLTQHNAGREAPPRVEAALLREFRAAKLAGSRRRVHGQLAALGAAAAILLALGLGVQHRIASQPHKATPQEANLATTPGAEGSAAVSYTHLDVYKRQVEPSSPSHISAGLFAFFSRWRSRQL